MEAKHEYCRALFSPFPLAEETKIRLCSQGTAVQTRQHKNSFCIFRFLYFFDFCIFWFLYFLIFWFFDFLIFRFFWFFDFFSIFWFFLIFWFFWFFDFFDFLIFLFFYFFGFDIFGFFLMFKDLVKSVLHISSVHKYKPITKGEPHK
jgi:hypothetical protein